LRIGLGVCCLATVHQAFRDASSNGGLQDIRSQDSISCQICREKGKPMKRWWMVSASWSQSRHLGWCCRPRLASRSAVQHRSMLAIQWKNLTSLWLTCDFTVTANSSAENIILTCDFTEEDAFGAISQMEHNKASGPDGFPDELSFGVLLKMISWLCLYSCNKESCHFIN
jgi:hypothetical protein